MATRRTTREADPDAPAPDPATTPNAVGASGSSFEGFIWQQLGEVQKSLGTIIANQATSEDRLKGLESKVSGLNRIVWIGVGIISVIGGLAAVLQPLVHLLIRMGIATPK